MAPARTDTAHRGGITASAEDVDAFEAYLRQRAHCDFHMLADLADEEFEFEDIPAVRGRDRRSLIERKLGQIHFGTPLKTAISCGRHKDGRRDERMLFAAFTRPQIIAPWLDALQRTDAAIDGIVSMAQLASSLPAASSGHSCRVMVTATKAGLRQTFLENGGLRFSRLAPGVSRADAPVVCAAEAGKLRQYLGGRLLADDAELCVTIVAERSEIERYRAHCADSAGLRFEYADLDEAARRAGLQDRTSTGIEALFVHLLMRRRPAEQFAPAAMRQAFVVRRANRTIRRAGWFFLALGSTVGALQLSEASGQREERTTLAALVEVEAAQRRTRLQALPATPLPPARLRAVIGRYDELARRSPGPAASCRLLADALAGFPQIALERLEWRLDAAAGQAVLDIHASLPAALAAEPRAQLAAVADFTQRLQAMPAVRVQTLSPPFNADPGKALTSKTLLTAERPTFSLRLWQRIS